MKLLAKSIDCQSYELDRVTGIVVSHESDQLPGISGIHKTARFNEKGGYWKKKSKNQTLRVLLCLMYFICKQPYCDNTGEPGR